MAKYLITWDAGFGESWDLFEAASEEGARDEAYRRWREDAESNADFGARLVTRAIAEEYDLAWEDK